MENLENPNYVTVMRGMCIFLVAVMKYDPQEEEYHVLSIYKRCRHHDEAKFWAKLCSENYKLEVR